MTESPASHTYREILRQSETLPVTLALLEEGAAAAIPWSSPGRSPLFLGCGTSYYLAKYAAWLARATRGASAAALPASELWLLPEGYADRGTDAVAISRSGRTSELILAADAVRAVGGRVLALTLEPGSPLTEHADEAIEFGHVTERSVVMTQSFSNLLLALQGLVLGGDDPHPDFAGLHDVVDAVAAILPRLDEQAQELAAAPHRNVVFLGVGGMEAIALEGMLKLKEMSQLSCECFGTLEFRHGPISVVDRGTLALILTTARTRLVDVDLARTITGLGGHALLLGAGASTVPHPDFDWVELPDGFADWQYANLAVPFLQLFGYHAAVNRQLNPDVPRHLSRVVEIADESPRRTGEYAS